MHENRETSASPVHDRAGRLEKAQRHTSGTYGVEGSDRAAIPVNQPNKEGQPRGNLTAEVGEGRARTKENTGQTHTRPTQSGGSCVSQGLAGVRQAAKLRKGERFTA